MVGMMVSLFRWFFFFLRWNKKPWPPFWPSCGQCKRQTRRFYNRKHWQALSRLPHCHWAFFLFWTSVQRGLMSQWQETKAEINAHLAVLEQVCLTWPFFFSSNSACSEGWANRARSSPQTTTLESNGLLATGRRLHFVFKRAVAWAASVSKFISAGKHRYRDFSSRAYAFFSRWNSKLLNLEGVFLLWSTLPLSVHGAGKVKKEI